MAATRDEQQLGALARIAVPRPDADGQGPGEPAAGRHSLESPRPGGGDAANSRFLCSKLKLDNLFLQWLSLPESNKLVLSLIQEAKNGRTLPVPLPSGNTSPLSPSTSPSFFTATVPPLSPQKHQLPASPTSPKRHQLGSHVFCQEADGSTEIPRFYFPDGKPLPEGRRAEMQARVDRLLEDHPDGLSVPGLKELLKQVLDLPGLLAYPLFYKLVDPGASSVRKEALLEWMQRCNVLQTTPVVRFYDVLRREPNQHVGQDDLKQMLTGILLSHPGLEFLQETPEFQDRYADTVIYRILYKLDRGSLGKLTLRDLKRGDLLDALRHLDEEEDVNKVLRYFSYEHFYVIYCKFWELDTDHDFLISKEDLIRYGNHSLTYRIVDRIFQVWRPFSRQADGKMSYVDFVWFILSEEDKSNDISLEYWFRCVDLDEDGCLRSNEMLYFYEEQLHRMECLAQEPVLFEDVLCQIHDMIQPAAEGVFTLADLRRARHLAGTLFNILFNLNKFVAFETRDPFMVRQEREDGHLTEWDRFAKNEYVRLAMEEEADDVENDVSNADVWEASLEAPF